MVATRSSFQVHVLIRVMRIIVFSESGREDIDVFMLSYYAVQVAVNQEEKQSCVGITHRRNRSFFVPPPLPGLLRARVPLSRLVQICGRAPELPLGGHGRSYLSVGTPRSGLPALDCGL